MLNQAFKFFPIQRPYTQRSYIWSFHRFQWGLCNGSYYGDSIKFLDTRSGENIIVSPFTGKKVKLINNSGALKHFLQCNCVPSFNNFNILAHENKKFFLEIKESFLVMRDKPSLNRDISFELLYLFDKVS